MRSTQIHYRIFDSPFGRILVAGSYAGLCRVDFQEGDARFAPPRNWVEAPGVFPEVEEQLSAYFAGERRSFDLVLDPGGTQFQQRVWRHLTEIPYGSTISYGRLAQAIGNPQSSRAVGAANGANPIPIIIPCHRVVGADGRLTGYRGGIELKRRLIELEKTTVEMGSLSH